MFSVLTKFKIGSASTLVATASAAILIFCHPLYAQQSIPEETAAPSPLQEKAALELRAADLIDSEEYTPTIINADGKVENLPVRTRYYYAADTTDKTVYQAGDEYSNIEILPDGKYRVYSADTFVYDPGMEKWRTIESATIDPAAFDAVMQEQIDPSLGDLLSGTFVAHAQETFNPSSDRIIQKGFCTSWAQCRDGGGPDYGCTSATADRTGVARNATIWLNARTFFTFDLSSLSGTVTAAELGFKTGGRDGTPTLHVVEASSNSCDPNSFYNVTWTSFGSVTPDADSSAAITINTTGEEYFTDKLGSNAIVALVANEELIDSQPAVDAFQRIVVKLSDQSGTADDPYLELTIEESEPPTQSTSTISYASSTPGLSLETSIYFLLFAVVFTLGGLIIFSWFRDWFY